MAGEESLLPTVLVVDEGVDVALSSGTVEEFALVLKDLALRVVGHTREERTRVVGHAMSNFPG